MMSDDKVSKQVNSAWDKLEKWLERKAQDAFEALPPGVTESEWQSVEASLVDRLGEPLPPEIRATYLRHNGTGDFGLSPSTEEQDMGYALIPLEELAEHIDAWAGQAELDAEVTADRGIKKQVWSDRWLPLATNGAGDYHVLDLDPAKGGKVGQIIEVNHETLERKKLAPGFLRLLQSIGNRLREKELEYDEDDGVCLPAGSKPLTPQESMAKAKQVLEQTSELPPGSPPGPDDFVVDFGLAGAAAEFGEEHFRHPAAAMNEVWRYLPTHAALWGYFYNHYDPLPSAKVNGLRLLPIREMVERSEPIILSAYAYVVAEADDGNVYYADHLADFTSAEVPIRRLPAETMSEALSEGWDDKKLRKASEKVAKDIADLCRKVAAGELP